MQETSQKLGERCWISLPSETPEGAPLLTSWFGASVPQNWERRDFCSFKPPNLWKCCYSFPRGHTHHFIDLGNEAQRWNPYPAMKSQVIYRAGLELTNPSWFQHQVGFLKSSIKCIKRCMKMCSDASHVRLFVTLWIVVHQAALSMGFFRQKYWSGLPFSSSRESTQGLNWGLLHYRQILYHLIHQGSLLLLLLLSHFSRVRLCVTP